MLFSVSYNYTNNFTQRVKLLQTFYLNFYNNCTLIYITFITYLFFVTV